jgi:multiple sugar transport system ATP-binding protein
MAEIRLAAIDKNFGQIVALANVTMTVEDGAFVVLLGPTGAGKTTTLRVVAGLDKADAGTIHIDGEDVTAWQPSERDVAMVFQQYSLYPHLSVRENLEFPLKSPLRKLPPAEIRRVVGEVAEMLHISHKLDNRATALSGGEMQRVSIGRALVRRPSIYLMDEPLSSLDAKLRAELRVELKRIQADLGATILYVTHDQIEAMTMATHIGVLRCGELVQFGSPREIYEEPDSIYVATRLGQPRINIVPVGVFGSIDFPAGTHSLGLRPENIGVGAADARGKVDARVRRIEHLGDQTRMHLSVNGSDLVTLTESHTPIQPGETIAISPVAPIYFAADGRRIGFRSAP